MVASSRAAVPGGLGVVQAALTLGADHHGGHLIAALDTVLVYRVVSLGGVALIGWTVHHRRPGPTIAAATEPLSTHRLPHLPDSVNGRLRLGARSPCVCTAPRGVN